MQVGSQTLKQQQFVASKWLKASAGDFLQWCTDSGEAFTRVTTMGTAISKVAPPNPYAPTPGTVATHLHEVLRRCDALDFKTKPQAVAYAGLHLLDRYERVMQVLQHLMKIGRLPLRKEAVKVLEVGAGPAPALYAASDFYAMLRKWAAEKDTKIAHVEFAHSLERGEGWDMVLHLISEHLMETRQSSANANGLPFSRTIDDFTAFSVRARHQQSVASHVQAIREQFSAVDDPISVRTATMMALENKRLEPSAYDLVFMCNFLTQTSMTVNFRSELENVSRSLTPGGVLVVMGGVSNQYPKIYDNIRDIASKARLTDVSPKDVFDASLGPHLDVIRDHTRNIVAAALDECDEPQRTEVRKKLSPDLWDIEKEFTLPKYQVLCFVAQKKP